MTGSAASFPKASSYLSNLEIAQHPTTSPFSSACLHFLSHLQNAFPSILRTKTESRSLTMRLLPLLVPLIPLASLVSAENVLEARSAYTTSIIATVTVTIFTGKSATHATVTQETVGGGGANNGLTVTSVETAGGGGANNGLTVTSVETAGGGGADSGQTITSVETRGGGGADSGQTITSVETAGGGGQDNGIEFSTKTVTVTRAAGQGAVVTPAVRWQGAVAGVAVGVWGLL